MKIRRFRESFHSIISVRGTWALIIRSMHGRARANSFHGVEWTASEITSQFEFAFATSPGVVIRCALLVEYTVEIIDQILGEVLRIYSFLDLNNLHGKVLGGKYGDNERFDKSIFLLHGKKNVSFVLKTGNAKFLYKHFEICISNL